jgi:uncharacterized repeat protein (TIGR03803 family)
MNHTRSWKGLSTVVAAVIAALALTTGAWGQSTYRILHTFVGGSDGSEPLGDLVFDAASNLYGTTEFGGCDIGCDRGTVWELKRNPNGVWVEQIIRAFGLVYAAGQYPVAGLTFDAAGNLWGTTRSGGYDLEYAFGVVYKLTPLRDGTWKETVITGFSGNGSYPEAPVTFDAAGNFYGTTWTDCLCGLPQHRGEQYNSAGVVYENGAGYQNIIHWFGDGDDGVNPDAGVIFDAAGNLYGTTTGGGPGGAGIVFELTPNGDGTWNESILHGFTGAADGANPSPGSLVFDSGGNLYGTTGAGGSSNQGVVYKLAPNGDGTWTESVLHSFTGGADGGAPGAGVVFDSAGNLYGTTYSGGAAGDGVVFKLVLNSKGWQEVVLHTFLGYGSHPAGGVILDSAGNLYGTASTGTSKGGVVYEITP